MFVVVFILISMLYLILLISLYAAGSDLTSLPTLFSFPLSIDGGGFSKVCRVLKLFPVIP